MAILMAMNIYITKENEQALREYKGSMSGLVNTLLDDFRKQTAQGFGTLAELGDKAQFELVPAREFTKPKPAGEAGETKKFVNSDGIDLSNPHVIAAGPNNVALCEHFQPKGHCLIKGCKYGKGKR